MNRPLVESKACVGRELAFGALTGMGLDRQSLWSLEGMETLAMRDGKDYSGEPTSGLLAKPLWGWKT